MTDGKSDTETRYACPKCGSEVAKRALLCPNCREPMTGDNVPIPVPVKPKAAAPAAREETPVRMNRRVPLSRAVALEDDDSTDTDGLPPLGRPVGDDGSMLKGVIDRIEGAWSTQGRRSGGQKRMLAAAAFAGVGLILLIRMLFVHTWTLESGGSSSGSSSASSVLAPQGNAAVATTGSGGTGSGLSDPSSVAGGPGSESGGGSQTAEAPAGSASSAPMSPEAKTLIAAAEQLDRLSPFLAPTADSTVPPTNPKGPGAVVPPIPQDRIPDANASPEARQEFSRLIADRDQLAMKVAGYIVAARQKGITGDRVAAVSARLRSKAESLGVKDAAGSTVVPSGTSYWAAPGKPLTDGDVDETIRVLLGPEDGENVIRALHP